MNQNLSAALITNIMGKCESLPTLLPQAKISHLQSKYITSIEDGYITRTNGANITTII